MFSSPRVLVSLTASARQAPPRKCPVGAKASQKRVKTSLECKNLRQFSTESDPATSTPSQSAPRSWNKLSEEELKVRQINLKLKHHLDAREYNHVIDVYQSMLKQGLKPDSLTFLRMISTMGRIYRSDKAQQFFDLMIKSGIKPLTQHYNSLMHAYCADGNLREAEMLFNEMPRQLVPRDSASYTTLIKTYASRKRFNDAENLFEAFKDKVAEHERDIAAGKLNPNDRNVLKLEEVLAGVMIDTYLRQDKIPEARQLLETVLTTGLTRRADAINNFLSAMLHRPEQDIRDETLALFDQLESLGSRCDAITYNMVLSYYLRQYLTHVSSGGKDESKMAHFLAKFDQIAQKMLQDKTIEIPPHVWGTLIVRHIAAGELDQANQKMKDLVSRGQKRTIHIYNEILQYWTTTGASQENALEEINKILSRLPEERLKPNLTTYNLLLHFYAVKEQSEAVAAMFKEMLSAGLRPDSRTYSEVLLGFRGQPHRLNEVIQDMKNSNIYFDNTIYATLIKVYQHSSYAKLDVLVREILQSGVEIELRSVDMSDVAKDLLDWYIHTAETDLKAPLLPPIQSEETNSTLASSPSEASSEIEPEKDKKKKKKVSKKKKPKAAAQEDLDDDDYDDGDDFVFDENYKIPESEMITDEDINSLEQDGKRRMRDKPASPTETREKLKQVRARAMSLYILLRGTSVALRPAFYARFIGLFRTQLHVCIAVAQDVLAQTGRLRSHYVMAENLIPIIDEETVLFHDDVKHWKKVIEKIKTKAEKAGQIPAFTPEISLDFSELLGRIQEGLKPAASSTHKLLADSLKKAAAKSVGATEDEEVSNPAKKTRKPRAKRSAAAAAVDAVVANTTAPSSASTASTASTASENAPQF